MILDRFKLTDQVAVVTGAGRGIGAATAVALAEAGADVVIASRTEAQLKEVAARVSDAGRRAVPVPVDLSSPEAAAALAATAVSEFGRLDLVVNNVGGTYPRPLLESTVDFMEEAFRFNVATAHALTVAAAPSLVETGGSVVNISSVMGRVSGRGFAAYGTAKAALAHYTRLAAADLAPRVRVNAISVGSVATSALEIVVGNPELKEKMESATPLRKIGEAEDIAATVVFLASRAGGYITGKILEVDGGLQAPNLELGLPDL
ncbi:7-alpha-hydroxysteroid dehydrogenase [Amycolatopsis mediterranei S699]|uniref:7-alpha-hydroxysteroid dehydrogenase n=2 Tax=Amycolatopsis mediterranei TaxID=33910 RepID=A0A0H3CZM3_AMYMU|nr:SDR family oxidoreductase [Amycolatopsis mediterranei]ADJ44102.1 7-alpha-hydroxysteroid dehydrogenase [Amycolatopsis mediterranei U32]AEK40837.1 short chain dehydrogenase [Amycolatopsis mediterranei S699]AFO75815.1 7-alpha-hydroxysteroid dehydrogenase [Amycolatopsis mediterranei S699]AGT82944.1 7-alpha-hydroxysteroid dehydrogenase [Amycolatopsis mediterranei RB]KDO06467.1 short-chain dehydrogenase [Amycolatopsis mediterranei]